MLLRLCLLISLSLAFWVSCRLILAFSQLSSYILCCFYLYQPFFSLSMLYSLSYVSVCFWLLFFLFWNNIYDDHIAAGHIFFAWLGAKTNQKCSFFTKEGTEMTMRCPPTFLLVLRWKSRQTPHCLWAVLLSTFC